MLQLRMYLWNSIRGYMYEFFNTDVQPLYHVVGKHDVDSAVRCDE